MDRASHFITSAQLTNAQPVAQGLEFHVYKASSPKHGPVALRVPQHRIFQNANDPNNDAKQLIDQELRIYQLFIDSGAVPVPKPYEMLLVDDYPAMLSEFVDNDGTEASAAEFGRTAALIHTTAIPQDWGVELVAMEGKSNVSETLVARMMRRFQQLTKEEPSSKEWIPKRETLRQIAEKLKRFPSVLLHMDFRDVNLRVKQGRIVAVLDWTNALIGPAAVDFYRIVELGKPGDDFFAAYAEVAPLPQVSQLEETFLRLDAALMLALVFISEAPDLELRGPSLRRVEELARVLNAHEL